ncbi:MAG: hypothetical protein FJX16_08000 [Alphaproteobacteria bacterium]|nr:hypothetical protein [Alphaproteobacteria bacterium]MBM3625244.1 hypothetical protein [Alphaproteobacteria bacterium]
MAATDPVRYPIHVDSETAEVGDAEELAVVLDVLNGRRDRDVLAQLRPHLPQIVRKPSDLPLLMRTLARDDQIFLIEAMGENLADALQTARHLRELLATIAEPHVKLTLIDTLDGPGLRKLVVTARDLAGTLEWAYAQCSLRLLELLGEDYLRRLIRHGDDLAFVLNAIAEEPQNALLTNIGWARVAELTRNARDLALLLRAVPPTISLTLLDQYDRRQLIEMIGDRRAWTYLYNRIKADEAMQLLRKLGADDAL